MSLYVELMRHQCDQMMLYLWSTVWICLKWKLLFAQTQCKDIPKRGCDLKLLTSCSLRSIPLPLALYCTCRKWSLRWRDGTLLLHSHAGDWAWHANALALNPPPLLSLLLLLLLLFRISISRCLRVLALQVHGEKNCPPESAACPSVSYQTIKWREKRENKASSFTPRLMVSRWIKAELLTNQLLSPLRLGQSGEILILSIKRQLPPLKISPLWAALLYFHNVAVSL